MTVKRYACASVCACVCVRACVRACVCGGGYCTELKFMSNFSS